MTIKLLSMTSVMAIVAGMANADAFNRIASFPTSLNNANAAVESSAEIVSASGDGMTLVYSDSPLGVIGMIDITDPTAPTPKGNINVGGEPTAVSIIGNTAFVGVNTSESYTAPSGMVKAFDLEPPPLKWSALIVRKRRTINGHHETQARRDCREVTAG
jgi:hypothetical protein